MSELLQAGSFQRCINVTKAPHKPSIHYCYFQQHTQFTIWPGPPCALRLMQINTAPLISGLRMQLTSGAGLAQQLGSALQHCSPATSLQVSVCVMSQPWGTPRAENEWNNAGKRKRSGDVRKNVVQKQCNTILVPATLRAQTPANISQVLRSPLPAAAPVSATVPNCS